MDRAKGVPFGTLFLFVERLSMGHNGVFDGTLLSGAAAYGCCATWKGARWN